MYGFWTAMTLRGWIPRAASSSRENETFSPVWVARGSSSMRSRGTPLSSATSAKISASGRVQISRGQRAQVPGEHDERGPAGEEHVGPALRDPRVVAAQHDDDVRGSERVVDVVVVPDEACVAKDRVAGRWSRPIIEPRPVLY